MIEFKRGFAEARVWFHRATPELVASGILHRTVDWNPTSAASLDYLTLEAFVPRGGYAAYGLLGFHYVRDEANRLQINVPYTDGKGAPWRDSLAGRVDDVRFGLPREFTVPILDAIAGVAEHRFPAGKLTVVEAAHGPVGSNPHLFGRIVACALSLMLDDRERDPTNIAAFLNEAIF